MNAPFSFPAVVAAAVLFISQFIEPGSRKTFPTLNVQKLLKSKN